MCPKSHGRHSGSWKLTITRTLALAKLRLVKGIVTQPNGLVYVPDFISIQQEQNLIGHIESSGLKQFSMYGKTVIRQVKGYGMAYNFERQTVTMGEELPDWLEPLCRQAEDLAGLPDGSMVQALTQKYPLGATIGWHSDKPQYGTVVGISLGSFCVMRFQKGTGNERQVYEKILNPRSAYVLSGDVRENWQHHSGCQAGEIFHNI
jgi:alkylated DNA repair protein (DNA oxidative demethylase)